MNTQEQGFRPITVAEKAILEKLLQVNFPGHDELAQQLADLKAKQIDAQGSLRFLVAGGASASISRGVAVEARYSDLDTKGEAGVHVNVLLHVADGKLSILGIYKDDGSRILRAPDPSKFQFFSGKDKRGRS
jgi:hypothetical protein